MKLRDRVGMEHVLHADVGCRNTLFNAVPQSAAEVVPTLLSRGLRDFRIELLSENEEETRRSSGFTKTFSQAEPAASKSGSGCGHRTASESRAARSKSRNPLAIL